MRQAILDYNELSADFVHHAYGERVLPFDVYLVDGRLVIGHPEDHQMDEKIVAIFSDDDEDEQDWIELEHCTFDAIYALDGEEFELIES